MLHVASMHKRMSPMFLYHSWKSRDKIIWQVGRSKLGFRCDVRDRHIRLAFSWPQTRPLHRVLLRVSQQSRKVEYENGFSGGLSRGVGSTKKSLTISCFCLQKRPLNKLNNGIFQKWFPHLCIFSSQASSPDSHRRNGFLAYSAIRAICPQCIPIFFFLMKSSHLSYSPHEKAL